MVERWAAEGVPLNVVCAGVDRYFERYYRKGPRRRPVRIDFCEADVMDVFDEWRRATGVTTFNGAGEPAAAQPAAQPSAKRGPSLREHLERVLIRFSSLRASGSLGPEFDPLIDRVSVELDEARGAASGLRGDARRALVERLNSLDNALLSLARQTIPEAMMASVRLEAVGELAAFRERMPPEAFDSAVENAASRLLRERRSLPVISFGG